jgi:heterotetrameric sarcosine oxidase gamma subunit
MRELELDYDAHARRAIVRLRVPMASGGDVAAALGLAGPLETRSDGVVTSLWIAPDQWLLVSDEVGAQEIVDRCAATLAGQLYLAVDATSAMRCAALTGTRVRDLLSMGSGLDWSYRSVPAEHCVRTRFARIAVVAHAIDESRFDVYLDGSHRGYLDRWLAHAVRDPLLREQ